MIGRCIFCVHGSNLNYNAAKHGRPYRQVELVLRVCLEPREHQLVEAVVLQQAFGEAGSQHRHSIRGQACRAGTACCCCYCWRCAAQLQQGAAQQLLAFLSAAAICRTYEGKRSEAVLGASLWVSSYMV